MFYFFGNSNYYPKSSRQVDTHKSGLTLGPFVVIIDLHKRKHRHMCSLCRTDHFRDIEVNGDIFCWSLDLECLISFNWFKIWGPWFYISICCTQSPMYIHGSLNIPTCFIIDIIKLFYNTIIYLHQRLPVSLFCCCYWWWACIVCCYVRRAMDEHIVFAVHFFFFLATRL